MDTLKEKHLLYRIAVHQDAEAFGLIYDHYVDTIYRFVFFKVGNQADAEDIVSEVFLKTWQHLQTSKNPVLNIRALLYTISRNKVVDLYRTRSKEKIESLETVAEIASSKDLLKDIESQDEVQKLISDIRLLKQEYQEVLLLRFVEELSLKEVAQVVGKKQTNVRVIIHRAVKKLEQLRERT